MTCTIPTSDIGAGDGDEREALSPATALLDEEQRRLGSVQAGGAPAEDDSARAGELRREGSSMRSIALAGEVDSWHRFVHAYADRLQRYSVAVLVFWLGRP